MSDMDLTGWIPRQFVWSNTTPEVHWTQLSRERLLAPFYEQTMQRQMTHPYHHLFGRETSVEQMADWIASSPPAPLRGFIFHMSRCGSTLVAQMLAASPRNVVVSEPEPLDGLLRACLRSPDLPRDTKVRWVRAMVGALGQPRAGAEQASYIKFDCWHVQHADLFREAFPEVPFLFLYRDPVEVLVSQARMPAAWTVPGLLHPLALRLRREDWDPSRLDVYRSRALASICESGLEAVQRYGGLLVNYGELPNAMFGRIFKHFSLSWEDVPAMLEQSRRDAKSPLERFQSDVESKQSAATHALREAAAQYLQPVYDRLETERAIQLRTAVQIA